MQARSPHIKRQRIVRIDPNVLTDRIAPAGADNAADREERAARLGDTVRLNLFGDVTPMFRRTGVSAQPDGGYVWEGDVPGKVVHEALLVVENGEVSGRIQLNQRVFTIDPIAGGLHRITEVDHRKLPPEAPPMVPPRSATQDSAQPQTAEESGDTAARANTVIRILVAYTVNARNEAGGTAAIVSQIKQAVALSNQAYKRGRIPITLVLAGTMQVNYNESSNISTDLSNLTGGGAPFTAVRTRRGQLNADLVSLFRRNDFSFCGIAWLPGTGTMPMPSAATKQYGYSIMVRGCVSNLSFHHELGHNMGIQHDRYMVPGQPNSFYNFGYVNKPKRQRTIMAYNNSCTASGFNCTRINWFSSPTIRATGNVVIGKARNTPGAADNTLRLRQTRTGISNYE